MSNQKDQFAFNVLPTHFEKDTHEGIRSLSIDKIHILNGVSASQDILVVIYEGSPLISFYNVNGQLIDVDHYLPEDYQKYDQVNSQTILESLTNYNQADANNGVLYKEFLNEMYHEGRGDIALGILKLYNLNISASIIMEHANITQDEYSQKSIIDILYNKHNSFDELMIHLISIYQKSDNGYVHITADDNIIITPLNKRSGTSVIIETKDINGTLLPANKWNIVRTQSVVKFNQSLVFRTQDVKDFFNSVNYEYTFSTDRYKLYITPDLLSMDSYLDNTDNLLRLPIYNNCYQILASDPNIIIALSNEQEVTVINTHKSVIPQKWPKKIVLPYPVRWARADENLSCLFVQNQSGNIEAFDITSPHLQSIGNLGVYNEKFEIDQRGDLIVISMDGQALSKIRTNIYDLNLGNDLDSFTAIFKDISHIFKGESLFHKTEYAQDITEIIEADDTKLPTAIEAARYDFESSIEHLLLELGNGYLPLLEVINKIAIARQNIAEELTTKSEAAGAILVGQRLNSAISNIVGPIEKRVTKLLDEARANNILELVRGYKTGIEQDNSTEAYREMLNNLRGFDQELSAIAFNIEDKVISEFKNIQEELNALFASQITNDDNELNSFIAGEIDQIELAIINTHEPRKLELLLSTHPASLELMSLLKQPFVLQSVAKGKRYSPAMIQKRLHGKIEKRQEELRQIENKRQQKEQAAKLQLANMIEDTILFFVKNHTGGFSDQELGGNAAHESILKDIRRLERDYNDVRLAQDLRRKLTRRILDRNREDLEKKVAVEGKYAYVQNDPDLYVDLESTHMKFPSWKIQITEKKGADDLYTVSYIRSTDRQVHKISTEENLRSDKAFELLEDEYKSFDEYYKRYITTEYSYELLDAIWSVYTKKVKTTDYPQYTKEDIDRSIPTSKIESKALRCALEKLSKEYQERNRQRYVPQINGDFIDETPYFQSKLQEFIIKAKLQKLSGSGIILLAGPPSTGKSVFLKFIASITNREYFEHTSDKWQTKNSLVTAIKFGEYGPYAIPAGFTKAITTSHSLINIEEIKEWPEALRKSLNPFFAGSKIFTAPDGNRYDIGEDILLCAAANLGAMYRVEDEPFTADFWSRIEVVEYDYAPEKVNASYYDVLLKGNKNYLITLQDLVRKYFNYHQAPHKAEDKAKFFAKRFVEFTLLPKADELVKRDNLAKYIVDYFGKGENITIKEKGQAQYYSPEEAVKVAYKRIKDFRSFNIEEFYDLYNHFTNNKPLKSNRLSKMKTGDTGKYNQLKVLILTIRYIEGCLRMLRKLFYSTAGQTEIEGTNREFIKCVYLLELMGEV